MATPKWQQKIKDQLAQKPMCFVHQSVPKGTPIKDIPAPVIKHVACLAEGEKAGKAITLRLIANYNCFNTCATCGQTVR